MGLYLQTQVMKNCLYYIFAFLVLVAGCRNTQQQNSSKDMDTLIKYQLAKNWPQLPAGFKLGNPTGIDIDTNKNIFIFHRAYRTWPLLKPVPESFITDKTILMLDRQSGKILNSWGSNLFIMPHGLTVDKNNNVWVTDVGLHQVFKFSHEGKLLMKLGEAKVAGDDTAHFNHPTDVAVADDGSFYVSDGYGNSRIVKFSSSGQYLFAWGKKGDRPGEFNIPHGICLDDKGNIYVADRENSRVQVFDSTGKFINQWVNKSFGNICSVTFDKVKNTVVAVDDVTSFYLKHKGSDIIFFDSAGNVLSQFGRSGLYDGPVCWYHDVVTDKEENIYVADILGNTIQKFKKISH